MSANRLTLTLIISTALLGLAACNTVQGMKADAQIVKEKAIEGGKAAGQAVGSGLEKAGEAIKGATN